MQRITNSGSGIAASAPRLALMGAVAITLTMFAPLSKSYAQSGCPPVSPAPPRTVVDPATGRSTTYLEVPSTTCVPYLTPGQGGPVTQLPSRATPVAQQPKSQDTTTPQESKPALVPVPIKTGVIRRKGKGNQVGPLKVEADAGTYAIKLVDKKSNSEVLMVFIGANQTFDTKVPLGTYKILGASGDVWYGERHLFGPSTSYFVLRRSSGVSFAGDDEFQFTLKGNTYHGHHIQLRKSVGGNLSTEAIKADEFQQQ